MFQIVGAFWYLFAVGRYDTCWHKACGENEKCEVDFLYCGNQQMKGYDAWQNISQTVIGFKCSINEDDPHFNYGIYTQALTSDIVASNSFFTKYCYCLWWGLQNLRYITSSSSSSCFACLIKVFQYLMHAILFSFLLA